MCVDKDTLEISNSLKFTNLYSRLLRKTTNLSLLLKSWVTSESRVPLPARDDLSGRILGLNLLCTILMQKYIHCLTHFRSLRFLWYRYKAPDGLKTPAVIKPSKGTSKV